MNLTRRALLLAGLWPVPAALAQAPAEARLKARLALTLARFTQWPSGSFASPGEPLLLCALHHSETVQVAFAELTGQTVNGHPVRVVDGSAPAGCHVLFVHESAWRAGLPLPIPSTPTLTIGDAEGFASRGGMIELVNFNDALRFDVHLGLLRGAQLDLSSRALQLARRVKD